MALVTDPAAAVIVKVPAVVVVKVVVAMPPVVVAVAGVNVAPVPPVAENVTLVPSDAAVPSAFLTVAVMVMGRLVTADVWDADKVTDAGVDALEDPEPPPPPQPAIIDNAETRNRLKIVRTFMDDLLGID